MFVSQKIANEKENIIKLLLLHQCIRNVGVKWLQSSMFFFFQFRKISSMGTVNWRAKSPNTIFCFHSRTNFQEAFFFCELDKQ